MKTYKDKIFAQFEPDIALKLLEFANTLSSQDCDVFVFMSRKFCCLYDLLLSVGIAPIQKPIVSDKVLDTETDFFKNKSVRIVDDILICGTTLWKAKNHLLNYLGAKEVKTSVFCVNDKYWVRELIQPDYKAIILDNDRALTFCSSIVRSISIAPRPYASEFPYFTGGEVKIQYWHQLISDTDWNVYDITDKLQEDNKVTALTYFPSDIILDDLKTTIGETVFNLIDIAKIRVYARDTDWGVNFSILPIITLKPLSKESIEEIFDNLIEKFEVQGFDENVSNKFKREFSNPVSQVRIIQYYLALILAAKFKFSIEKLLTVTLNTELSHLDVELLFGKWNLPIIKALEHFCFNEKQDLSLKISNIESSNLHWESTELTDLMSEKEVNPITSPDNHSEDNPRNFFSDFSNIFLSLYHKKELPSREIVRQSAINKEWNKIKTIDRLETGVTWLGILEYLRKTFDYALTPTVKNVLSLVLDYSIDKGICVPVTRYNLSDNILFRAYRHGEDVLFSEQETELCGLVIENAQKAISKDSISRLFIEKLLVLFIKVGASKNILQTYYGTGGQDGVAKIGFYLQGAVAKLKRGNSFRLDSEIWLTRHLLEKKVIKVTGKGQYSFSNHYNAIQISTHSRIEAQKFGHYLGLLHKGYLSEQGLIRLEEDELIFLSTCFRPKDVAAALLVELDIYSEKLFPLIEEISNAFEAGKLDKSKKHQEIWLNKGFVALNSLHKKTIGWAENGAQKAIDKGIEIFDYLNSYPARLDWESYWASLNILKREDEETTFNEMIFKLSSLGHRLLFYLNLLEVFLSYSEDNRSYQTNEKMQRSIDKFNSFYTASISINENIFTPKEAKLFERLKEQVANDFVGLNEERTFRFIFSQFYESVPDISRMISVAQKVLTEFEQVHDGVKYYNLVIYYDMVDSTAIQRMKTGEEVESYLRKVKNISSSINNSIAQMQKEALKENDEIFCWNGTVDSHNDGKYIYFSSKSLGFSIRRARQVLDRMFALGGAEGNFRIIVASTNAFYSDVFRNLHKTEVEGDDFLSHFSRIQKQFKELENEYVGHRNLILLVGNQAKPLKGKEFNLRHKLWEGNMETTIGGRTCTTKVELCRPK